MLIYQCCHVVTPKSLTSAEAAAPFAVCTSAIQTSFYVRTLYFSKHFTPLSIYFWNYSNSCLYLIYLTITKSLSEAFFLSFFFFGHT